MNHVVMRQPCDTGQEKPSAGDEQQLLAPGELAGADTVQQKALGSEPKSGRAAHADERNATSEESKGKNQKNGSGNNMDEEISDDEDEIDLRHASFGGRWVLQGLEERRAKAGRRLKQSKAYAELVEDRLLDLESKVRDIIKLPGSEKYDQGPKPPTNKLEILSVGWVQFGARHEVDINSKRSWKHTPEVNTNPKSVIEVLTEEPRYDYHQVARTNNDTITQDSAKVPTDDGSESMSGLDGDSNAQRIEPSTISVRKTRASIPYRIRIRSPVLLKLISEITGFRTVVGPHKHTLVFFRPFKLLVASANVIKERLKQVEKASLAREPKQKDPDKEGGSETEYGPANETDTDEAGDQLRLLCKLFDMYLQPKIEMRHGFNPNFEQVSFDDLWYIFKPGDEIRTPGKNQIQLYRILKVTGGREILQPHADPPSTWAATKLKNKGYSLGSFIIECFCIRFDGLQFGPVNFTFHIRKFEGKRDVMSLPVMPFHCDPKKTSVREYLLKRGNKFAELTSNPAHRKYKGLSLGERQQQVESQVIIDFQLAFIENPTNKPEIGLDGLVDDDPREIEDMWRSCSACPIPGCCGNDIIYDDYEVDETDRSAFKSKHNSVFDTRDLIDQLTDDQKVLLPCRVHGFILRSRRWDVFDIDLLGEVDYDSASGWNKLVIDETIKKTVLALVQNHERPQDSQKLIDGALSSVDLVQGKGKGLIILLHGEPGVGKTSTAECVADHTHRPLFPITCGDIGDTAQTVENNLEKNFQLAHKWGCVLLLDEADIFLSKRTSTDIIRNAIVSVFLRSLEYYSGILFLTTNRVGTIDRAFKSRIHLTLYYPSLNKKRTRQIWENNIDLLKQELKKDGKEIGKDFKFNEASIIEFAKKHFKELKEERLLPWNGRQIRNAFQTAVAIANYEAKSKNPPRPLVLDAKQFEKVAKSAKLFDEYLRDLSKGKTDAELALDQSLRIDDWESFRLVKDRAPKPIPRSDYGKKRDSSSSSESESESDSDRHTKKRNWSSSRDSSNEEPPKKTKKKKQKRG